MDDFAKLAAGALFGVVVGLLVQWWKSSRDEFRLLCDEFSKSVRDASDLASGYWLTAPEAEGLRLVEVRMLGLQQQLDGYRVLIDSRLSKFHRTQLGDATAALFDAMTGGDFKSTNRAVSFERATLVQERGAALVLTIRQKLRRLCHSVVHVPALRGAHPRLAF